jgi:hypothetical protein
MARASHTVKEARGGADVRRPAETLTPGAVARFSFEPPRALGPYLLWSRMLEASPGPSKAERFDRLRGRSDQARVGTRLRPSNGGSQAISACARPLFDMTATPWK